MAHKMGSAPSQYFQGDGAKPGAQSHNLSYNSTGWVASAVLVNTLFRSVCLLISHNPSPIRLSHDLSSFLICTSFLPIYTHGSFIPLNYFPLIAISSSSLGWFDLGLPAPQPHEIISPFPPSLYFRVETRNSELMQSYFVLIYCLSLIRFFLRLLQCVRGNY